MIKENEKEIEMQLLDKLAENVKGDIPEVMVDNEINGQIRDIDYRLSMQGMNFETYLQYTGMTMEAYRDTLREAAEKQVKMRLALEKVAELENIVPSEEEINGEYEKETGNVIVEPFAVKSADDIPAVLRCFVPYGNIIRFCGNNRSYLHDDGIFDEHKSCNRGRCNAFGRAFRRQMLPRFNKRIARFGAYENRYFHQHKKYVPHGGGAVRSDLRYVYNPRIFSR